MSKTSTSAFAPRRAATLAVAAFLVLAPVAWIGWSVHAAGVTSQTIAGQSDLLAKLRQRVASLQPEEGGAGDVEPGSVFLPGETPAIAGAALQRIVADAVEAAGGRVIETEFARVEAAAEDPGRVDLRVAFDADIVGLQKVLLQLESSLPVLLIRSLDVQTSTEATEEASPPLRVLMLVGGYLETAA